MGIRRVAADEAFKLVGRDEPGLYIPYPDVEDLGKPYGRLRVDSPRANERKYHQEAGTKPHIYCLPSPKLFNGDLLIVEGEFKAICLNEAGFPAIGISGFYSWGKKDKDNPEVIHMDPTFVALLEKLKPRRIVFIGDPDTATNFQFTDAVAKLIKSVSLPVALFRIEYDEKDGKGVDDIREKLGPDAFNAWFLERLRTAEEFPVGTHRSVIRQRLLEREESIIAKLTGADAERVKQRLTKMGAFLKSEEIQWLSVYAKRVLGLKKTELKQAIDAHRESAQEEQAATAHERSRVLSDFVMVGSNFYGFSVDPITRKKASVLTPCHKDFVVQTLLRAGYSKKAPSAYPGLTMLQSALWELNRTRCRAVTELLFRPYGRVLQSDGTTVFNNSQVQVLQPVGDVKKLNDPALSFTARWLESLFKDWDQLSHFLSLLSYAYCCALGHKPKKTLAVFLVGPPSSGKSLLIDFWLPRIFGQEVASDSHRLLKGENGASAALRHYVCKLSDKDLGNESDVRRVRMGMLSLLADFTTGGKLMYENVTVEEVINLFAFSSNPDGSVIDLLRDIPESIKSKIAIYSCGGGLLSIPKTKDVADFVRNPSPKLLEELPAFCSLLANWSTHQKSSYQRYFEPRFGVKAFCHPDIASTLTATHEETVVFEALLEIDEQNKRASQIYDVLVKRQPSFAQVRMQRFTKILRKIAGNRNSGLVSAREYEGPDGSVKNAFFTISGTAEKTRLQAIQEAASAAVAAKKPAKKAEPQADKVPEAQG